MNIAMPYIICCERRCGRGHGHPESRLSWRGYRGTDFSPSQPAWYCSDTASVVSSWSPCLGHLGQKYFTSRL